MIVGQGGTKELNKTASRISKESNQDSQIKNESATQIYALSVVSNQKIIDKCENFIVELKESKKYQISYNGFKKLIKQWGFNRSIQTTASTHERYYSEELNLMARVVTPKDKTAPLSYYLIDQLCHAFSDKILTLQYENLTESNKVTNVSTSGGRKVTSSPQSFHSRIATKKTFGCKNIGYGDRFVADITQSTPTVNSEIEENDSETLDLFMQVIQPGKPRLISINILGQRSKASEVVSHKRRWLQSHNILSETSSVELLTKLPLAQIHKVFENDFLLNTYEFNRIFFKEELMSLYKKTPQLFKLLYQSFYCRRDGNEVDIQKYVKELERVSCGLLLCARVYLDRGELELALDYLQKLYDKLPAQEKWCVAASYAQIGNKEKCFSLLVDAVQDKTLLEDEVMQMKFSLMKYRYFLDKEIDTQLRMDLRNSGGREHICFLLVLDILEYKINLNKVIDRDYAKLTKAVEGLWNLHVENPDFYQPALILGLLYKHGIYVDQNLSLAVELFSWVLHLSPDNSAALLELSEIWITHKSLASNKNYARNYGLVLLKQAVITSNFIQLQPIFNRACAISCKLNGKEMQELQLVIAEQLMVKIGGELMAPIFQRAAVYFYNRKLPYDKSNPDIGIIQFIVEVASRGKLVPLKCQPGNFKKSTMSVEDYFCSLIDMVNKDPNMLNKDRDDRITYNQMLEFELKFTNWLWSLASTVGLVLCLILIVYVIENIRQVSDNSSA